MEIDHERVEAAARRTRILRYPRQQLSTFGVTNICYYMVTEPAYSELTGDANETVIRDGRVIADRPKIVTPYYLSRLEGFSYDARKYFDALIQEQGPNTPGLFYTYRNEPKELNIVSDGWPAVVAKLNREIDEKNDPLAAIIKGEDDLWDVSLLRFIYEITRHSLQSNISQLGARGFFNRDASGIPAGARARIEELFGQVARGESPAHELERELNHWGIFEEFQDRFFAVIRGKS
jgi:hypothetical protein